MLWIKEPLSRLKWGFIPVRRIVDEDLSEEEIAARDAAEDLQEGAKKEEEEENQPLLEYRDEAHRPWYKFFDEYEYRLNSHNRKTHKWYKWFDENDTPAERKLMWKIDILLTFYAFMAYWVKYLDQTNLNNAYVAGLKTDIGMKGNDLVNTQVLFSVGNIVFQIPFMYVLYGLPLNYVLPILDLCWSLLTIGASRVHSLHQLKVIRFFIGAFEAPSYLAYQYLFGSFIFNPAMIARRSMFYYFGQYLGTLTSGLLSGAVVRRFEGVGGMAAWRWIFIIDGIISVVVGIIGFYMLPGTPTDCYSIWLTDDEIRLLRKKLRQNNTAGRPQVDVLKYGAGKLQDYSALTPGLGLLWLFVTCMYADLFHLRWLAIWLSQVFNIACNVILAVWYVPERLKWFAWCLQYFGWAMAPVLYSWQNDICRRDAQKRAVILVFMNMLAQASTAWMSVIVWKTVEAPRFLKGFSWTASCAFALCVWTLVVLWFYKRQERSYARENGIVLYNSKTDPEPIDVQQVEVSDGKESSNNSL
ncbi:CIC11C00000002875 [Sungouiella intermedia]|uniref:CIC11C00000002875 n=1 Tax=Sungouiella intermedia TaxID=45354 RepID=A0A1L0CZL3_9ASCO|nr:CIC11C00000002875 [[Candida] intermedia]